jgi:hypothetical protein
VSCFYWYFTHQALNEDPVDIAGVIIFIICGLLMLAIGILGIVAAIKRKPKLLWFVRHVLDHSSSLSRCSWLFSDLSKSSLVRFLTLNATLGTSDPDPVPHLFSPSFVMARLVCSTPSW